MLSPEVITGPAAPFPTDALPAFLGAYCQAFEESTQTPVDAIAVLTLGVFATAIQGRVTIEPAPGWVEQSCLFELLVMGSGTKKSATFRAAFAPVERAERELAAWREPERVAATRALALAKGRAAAAAARKVDPPLG